MSIGHLTKGFLTSSRRISLFKELSPRQAHTALHCGWLRVPVLIPPITGTHMIKVGLGKIRGLLGTWDI